VRAATTQGLLLAAAAIDIVFPLTVAVLDATNPDLDPIRNTLSKHALRPGFPWMALAFLAHSLALLFLAWGLHRLPPRPWAAPVCLTMTGIASALLAVFPDDPPHTETVVGHLHESVATIAFLGIMVGALCAHLEQRRTPAWSGMHVLPSACAFALVVTLSAFGALLLVAQFDHDLRHIYGVTERLVIVSIGAWMVTTLVQGSRVAVRRGPDAAG
jgi:uncharacterized membrane protein